MPTTDVHFHMMCALGATAGWMPRALVNADAYLHIHTSTATWLSLQSKLPVDSYETILLSILTLDGQLTICTWRCAKICAPRVFSGGTPFIYFAKHEWG